MMSNIEIRFGRRLVIRAAGRSAVALTILGLIAAAFIVADRLERGDTVQAGLARRSAGMMFDIRDVELLRSKPVNHHGWTH